MSEGFSRYHKGVVYWVVRVRKVLAPVRKVLAGVKKVLVFFR